MCSFQSSWIHSLELTELQGRVFTLKERRNCINKCDLIECSGPFLLLWSSLLCHEAWQKLYRKDKKSPVPIRRNANAFLTKFLALLISLGSSNFALLPLLCAAFSQYSVDSFQLEFSSTQLYVFRKMNLNKENRGSFCTGWPAISWEKVRAVRSPSESASRDPAISPTMKECKAVSLLSFLGYA